MVARARGAADEEGGDGGGDELGVAVAPVEQDAGIVPALRAQHLLRRGSVSDSSSQCDQAHRADARGGVRCVLSAAGLWPGTPWVVHVNTLKKATPAAHSGRPRRPSPGQAWAPRPKSTYERPRR